MLLPVLQESKFSITSGSVMTRYAPLNDQAWIDLG